MAENGGFIKLDRALLNWRYKDKPSYVALWVDLLLKANYEGKMWHEIQLERGQFVTSLDHLSKDTGLSIQSVRTILEKLNNDEIIVKSTNKYTQITILKYSEYQDIDKKLTNNQQTTNKQLTINQQTTNNNIRNKEYKEIKNKYIYTGFDDSVIPILKEFEDMRTKMKKPMTDKAKTILANKLKDLSGDPNTQIKIIEQSILKGWTSVYPLKAEKVGVPSYEW